jgi:lysophospholipase L1-like esterase
MRQTLLVIAGGLLVLAGCSSGSVDGLNPVGAIQSGAGGVRLAGTVRGGQQPLVGAHVYLFAANTANTGVPDTPSLPVANGQDSVSLLNQAQTGTSDSVGAYVTTDSNGNFSVSGDYSCTPGAGVYLYALGGNAGGGTNSAAGLMAVLGSCPGAGTFSGTVPFVVVNEVSTVAAAYAMADFATNATGVWSTGTTLAQTGIANAFANAANLVNLSTGVALTATPGGNVTVPQAEINTLGNILAACVNSTGPGSSACSTLFNNAQSGGSSGTVPGDTATAAINIAHNYASNVANLYALASATPPFAPALSSQPGDFSIPLVATPSPPTYFRNALNSGTVFMGDSITQWWNLPINNQGIAGQTAAEMQARFATDVIGLGYKRVVILAGTNDIWNIDPPDQSVALAAITSMAQMASTAGIEVVLCTLPANHSADSTNPNFYPPLYGPFNQSIADIATTNGYLLVDYYTPTLSHPEYFTDGVHPNATGYAVMEAALSAVVTQ